MNIFHLPLKEKTSYENQFSHTASDKRCFCLWNWDEPILILRSMELMLAVRGGFWLIVCVPMSSSSERS